MQQVDVLKIFLASPGDVVRERNYVIKVIDEINRTTALSKGVRLEVVRSEENVFPGYSPEGGQAVLNAQIANMEEYALFIGIMWNRVGTPTPRAVSGTIEEFERAVKAWKSKKQPDIWFYFRQAAASLNTDEEIEQRQKVLNFRKTIKSCSFIRDYKNPSNFRDEFRIGISLWLAKLPNKTSKPSIAAANPNKKSLIPATKSQTATTKGNNKKRLTSNSTADNKAKSSSTTLTKKRSSAGLGSTGRTRSINTSGALVMLSDNFFRTQSVETQANQTITLHVLPTNSEQEAALRDLQPEQSYNKKQIAYAYQDDAAMMQVESVVSKSIEGKTIFILTLSRDPSSQRSSSMEVNFNGYSADQIAELRARLLLLNEIPSIQNSNNFMQIDSWVEGGYGYDNAVKFNKNIFPDLWKKLKIPPSKFLPHARLIAVYYLKMSGTVEHILELKLGLIKGNVMSVQFRGKRKSPYINQESAVIQFKGTCPLNG